ncbi:DUF3168 domain-containing protein [Pseudomonas aeruginosa]|uniref:tail completion protein gp17 n=1 Tax=Pseudomonas aeruginosa TaxID=287 RepID=UPI00053F0996|nr:DUF3168 domain-containing protein [Pseudomonas aeruginosa]MBA6427528.1 DUF3168 domain-containing protein [Pseudomonas aeruginosa]MCO2135705.1 DUF3168 domain-containing protein [Pseudomonas aeruginosa]MDG3645789.1 DUF3168 domain-containing protein [Pseudomonas aeruginosa]MDG3915573.1 DUF3168 domain-containing protein [Pseudomonas aeruginosa]MDG3959196.1 DUF3168 domain-containing protein [Pseudomonas aeruginosa]
MYAPIFKVCSQNPGVVALLGAKPTRLYLFAEAPDQPGRPYATWQTFGGEPENYLAHRPDIDSFSLQVDVFADTAAQARAVATAIRNAIELRATITRWSGEERDDPTDLYRISFDVDWWVNR